MHHIADLTVPFPDDWYAVPQPCPDPAVWAAGLADELASAVEAAQAADATSADATSDDAPASGLAGAPEGPLAPAPVAQADRRAVLAEQLEAVARSLADPDVEAAHGAVLVRDPAQAFVGAMAVVTVTRDLDEALYVMEADGTVVEALEHGAFHATRVDATCAMGAVRGVYSVEVETPEDALVVDGAEGLLPALVERLQLAVFPEGSADAVELLLLPSTLGVFADPLATATALLDSATLRLVPGAVA